MSRFGFAKTSLVRELTTGKHMRGKSLNSHRMEQIISLRQTWAKHACRQDIHQQEAPGFLIVNYGNIMVVDALETFAPLTNMA